MPPTATTPAKPRRSKLESRPALGLVLTYVALARACLALAFATVALEPQSVAGFFYHPRMLAVVHLVTLGWITLSIFGTLYMIGPLAFGLELRDSRRDRWALGLIAFGITGMVSHFWIEELSGMAWSAATLTAGLALASTRLLPAWSAAHLPLASRLPFYLAFGNLFAAAGIGVLIAFDRYTPFLPGTSLHRVFAHAHLAALGWATLMVVAAGYRLLPMLLPAAVPPGRAVVAGAMVYEVGVLLLAVALLVGSPWAALGAALVALGLAVFASRVVWMLRHRRPPPPQRKPPVFTIWHVLMALLHLGAAAALGLVIATTPAAVWKLDAILVYGTLGLVGFLAQMVVGVAGYLLPIYSWSRASSDERFLAQPTPVHAMSSRPLRAAIWGLWALGVPAVALGFGLSLAGWLRVGGALLLAAVLLESVDAARILRHAARR